jgi:hypothetical protein
MGAWRSAVQGLAGGSAPGTSDPVSTNGSDNGQGSSDNDGANTVVYVGCPSYQIFDNHLAILLLRLLLAQPLVNLSHFQLLVAKLGRTVRHVIRMDILECKCIRGLRSAWT